jgi:hypothetical protein
MVVVVVSFVVMDGRVDVANAGRLAGRASRGRDEINTM